MSVAEKWDGRMPNVGSGGGDWKQRARRAEAERGAARAQAISTQLQTEARAREHERQLKEATESIGWRITAPLRALARLAPSRANRRAARAESSSLGKAGAPRRAQSRDPLRQREALRDQEPAQQVVLARPPLARDRRLHHADVFRGEVTDAVGLEALEDRVAVPRREHCRHGVRPWRRRGARRRRSRRRPAPRRVEALVLAATKSSTAVSTPLRGPPSRAAGHL